MSRTNTKKKFEIIPGPINMNSEDSEDEDEIIFDSPFPNRIQIPNTSQKVQAHHRITTHTTFSAPISTKVTPKVWNEKKKPPKIKDISENEEEENSFLISSSRLSQQNSFLHPQASSSLSQSKVPPRKPSVKPSFMLEDYDNEEDIEEEEIFSRNYSQRSQFWSENEIETSLNFSSMTPEKASRIDETTIGSLQFSSQDILLRQLQEKYERQLKKIGMLEQEVKQQKLMQAKKMQKKRKQLDRWIENVQKQNTSLRAECLALEKEANQALEKQKLSPEYRNLEKVKDQIMQIEESFKQSDKTVQLLNGILVYDPLSKRDFEMIFESQDFESELGKKLKLLIEITREVLAQSE